MIQGQKYDCLCLDLNSESRVYPVKADVLEAEFMNVQFLSGFSAQSSEFSDLWFLYGLNHKEGDVVFYQV